MTVLTVASAVHDLSAVGSTIALHVSGLADGIPNPAPKAPPGLTGPVNTLLAWWKWGALVAGVFGLIGCGAMMASQALSFGDPISASVAEAPRLR